MKRYNIHLYCLFFLSWLYIPVLADNIPHSWQQGEIFLDDKVLEGKVHYDEQLDVVFYKEGEYTRAFTAQTISLFKFEDEEMGVTRTFQSLAHDREALHGQREFYEIVMDGDITLARKSKCTHVASSKHVIPVLPLLITAKHSQGATAFNYFILENDGLTRIKNFKKQVLPLMKDQQEEIDQFMDDYNFNLHKPTSYMLVINYYNHLKTANLTAQK